MKRHSVFTLVPVAPSFQNDRALLIRTDVDGDTH